MPNQASLLPLKEGSIYVLNQQQISELSFVTTSISTCAILQIDIIRAEPNVSFKRILMHCDAVYHLNGALNYLWETHLKPIEKSKIQVQIIGGEDSVGYQHYRNQQKQSRESFVWMPWQIIKNVALDYTGLCGPGRLLYLLKEFFHQKEISIQHSHQLQEDHLLVVKYNQGNLSVIGPVASKHPPEELKKAHILAEKLITRNSSRNQNYQDRQIMSPSSSPNAHYYIIADDMVTPKAITYSICNSCTIF